MGSVRIITPDQVVSSDTYEKPNDDLDARGRLCVIDRHGNNMQIHAARVVPVDSLKKAVVLKKGDGAVGYCPTCPPESRYSAEPQGNGQFECPEHGVFDTIGDTIIRPIRKKKTKRSNKEGKTVTDETKTTAEPKRAPAQVDLTEVGKHGELWSKGQIAFDHAKVDVQAHTLIKEEPLRKLTFNTYNGTLGKKSRDPVQELQLDRFVSNDSDNGKAIGYIVKGGDVEALRTELKKKGYTKHG